MNCSQFGGPLEQGLRFLARASSLAFLAFSSYAWPASFDCNKATTTPEKAICANPELSKTDDGLAAAYAELKRRLSPTAFSTVRESQLQWLRMVSKSCVKGDPKGLRGCLLTAYQERSELLRHALSSPWWGLPTYIVGVLVEDRDSGGFENRTFSFVDSQESHAVAVNQLMSKEMQKALHGNDGCNACSQSWQPAVWISKLFVGIESRTEASGGAHPVSDRTCLVFSIDKQRYLTLSDVFVGPEYIETVNRYAARHFTVLKQENPDMTAPPLLSLTAQEFSERPFEGCSGKDGYFVDGFLPDAERALDGVTIPWSVLASKMTPFARGVLLK